MAKRPNILKLATKISLESMTYMGITYDDPEYKILEPIIDDDMCAIMMHVRLETNRTVEEVAKRARKSVEFTQEQLDKLCKTGAVRYRYVDGKRCYFYPIWVPGIMEGILANREQCDKYPVLGESFEAYTRRRPEMLAPMLDSGKTGMFFMRVMPVMSAIENDSHAASYDEVRTLIENATAISVGPCSCRRARRLMGEGCGHLEEDMCMYLNDNARCFSEQGYHRLVTKEEAYEILQRAEDNGYVHQITNIDGEDKIFAICNCALGSCFALRTSQLFNTPNMSASAYRAHVDAEKCVACGKCAEVCPAGAAKLGQKLCTKTGPVVYPQQPLPDDNHWGEHMWSEDYRDKNRINCHDSGTAPCKTACPAHIAVQGYLKKASEGKYREALELIKRENPFPAVCGRICNRRCEEACTRGTIDQAVSIDAVKKFIAEQDLNAEHRFVPEIVVASNLGRWKEKIAVIGGGPAGLSCAFYLAQKGYYPTVFEKNERAGGMLTYGIPSYKLDKKVIDAEIDIMREMGVEIKLGVEVGKDVTIAQLREQGYKAFYVAIGCQGGRLPGIEGENAPNVTTAVEFLKNANCGQMQGKIDGQVVVVGGGNVAIDAARVSARSGASKVTMLCLEQRNEMPASAEEVAEAEADGVTVNCGWGPMKVLTDDNGVATAVVFKKCVSVYDENKRFAPVYDVNDTVTVPADKVVFAIGQAIEWGNLLEGSKVETVGRGKYPQADKLTYQTAEPDIFVGGDVFTGPKFAIDAIAQGHEAAECLHRYVQHGHMTIGLNRREFIQLDTADIAVESYDHAPRQAAAVDTSVDAKGFGDNHGTLTEEQVRVETSRCLGCGASIVDPNKCIGCGLCTTKCAFDAIHLSRDLPEASNMRVAEKKFGAILPYAIKRGFKILGNKNNVGKKKKNDNK